MDDNEDKTTKENDKIYKIIFEKRNTRANIRMGINLGVILIIALIVVGLFFNFIIKYKYGDVIEEIKKNKINTENTVIIDYSTVMQKVAKSIVTIVDTESNSSVTGTVITERGIILTSYSAIKDMKKLDVILNGDTENVMEGKIAFKNEEYDLALVQVEYEGELIPIDVADQGSVNEGQGIAVIGSIYSDGNKVNSIVPGVVTIRYNNSGSEENLAEEYNLLQVNAPVNSNNNGGPICNSKGELIGMASLYLTEKYKIEGLYYGVQIDNLENLINSTVIIKEVLGITEGGIIIDADNQYQGFYVGQLQKGGNAYKAEIKPTDIILAIDNIDITSIDKVTDILSAKNKGDSLNCKVLSDGEIEEVIVKLNS